ncbi:hypothetical protein CYJ70_03410 [Gardnerella pickettii]|uniref:Serine/threonine protein kinase n=1 Tax=Gardnerella pickettii TaxID=2914924 RepID=A0ABX4SHA7_9BIFI|nr:hypothetical protein CYJ70_03410 [Gardnerella pickettii]
MNKHSLDVAFAKIWLSKHSAFGKICLTKHGAFGKIFIKPLKYQGKLHSATIEQIKHKFIIQERAQNPHV